MFFGRPDSGTVDIILEHGALLPEIQSPHLSSGWRPWTKLGDRKAAGGSPKAIPMHEKQPFSASFRHQPPTSSLSCGHCLAVGWNGYHMISLISSIVDSNSVLLELFPFLEGV